MRFVDIKNDVAFRKIFGNKKKTKCLISFLNTVLGLEGYIEADKHNWSKEALLAYDNAGMREQNARGEKSYQ